jgi:3-(3-hydroxy-phenyl)propionate hydroxylase
VLRVGADRDPHGFAAARYGEALYLIRPDQHVAARLTGASAAQVRAALARAKGEGS